MSATTATSVCPNCLKQIQHVDEHQRPGKYPEEFVWACIRSERPFRQDIFDYFSQNHGLTLTESEMEDIAQVVSKQLCVEKTNLINENTCFRADSEQLGRFVDKINVFTPEFKTAFGAPCDHAEVALGFLIESLGYYRKCQNGERPDFVPARVMLTETVRADSGERNYRADPGDHECESNQWGAVSVKAANGKMLGIKPGEFIVIAWRANDRTQ